MLSKSPSVAFWGAGPLIAVLLTFFGGGAANAQSDCVSIWTTAEGSGRLSNICYFKVIVEWTDDGYCQVGCTAVASGGTTQSITRPNGYTSWRYCEYDAWARGDCRL